MKIVEGKVITNFKELLNEARISQLAGKTRSQTDNIGNRVNGFEKVYKNGIAVGTRELPKMSTDYIGISKFGIFNFRTTSQTHQGNYWYQTIEIPDLGSKLQDEKITPDLIRDLFERGDVKVYCDCLTGDMKILMSDGTYKDIKDIQEGDKVVTHLGNIKTVTGKSSRPSFDDLIELDLGNRKIKCTENHQFLVLINGKETWVKAKDLTEDMELLELGDI